MIKSAAEMKAKTNESDIHRIGYKRAVESVMRAIEKASVAGRTDTCFNPPAYWYTTDTGLDTFIRFDDEVKEAFRKQGYTFKPTGYIGGVWQHTEQICW